MRNAPIGTMIVLFVGSGACGKVSPLPTPVVLNDGGDSDPGDATGDSTDSGDAIGIGDTGTAVPPADAPSPSDPALAPLTQLEICYPPGNDPDRPPPSYAQFNPTIGTHCLGTNHQAIDGIERVVFLGDSITEGTPPTAC